MHPENLEAAHARASLTWLAGAPIGDLTELSQDSLVDMGVSYFLIFIYFFVLGGSTRNQTGNLLFFGGVPLTKDRPSCLSFVLGDSNGPVSVVSL